MQTCPWSGTGPMARSLPALTSKRKKDVNVTGNFVLEINFVTFTSPLHFFTFSNLKCNVSREDSTKSTTKCPRIILSPILRCSSVYPYPEQRVSAERSFERSLRFGGGQFGEKFFAKFGAEVLAEVFGLVLLGHAEQKRTSAKTSAQKFHGSAQQSWRKFREQLHDGVLQETPRQPYPSMPDFAGKNSDHGPSKTQTKTQTNSDSVFTSKGETLRFLGEGKLRPWSKFGVFWG